MLTQNLPLDGSNGTEVTFNLQSYLPDGARRIDVNSTNTDAQYLEIKHTVSGKGAAITDRHLISTYAVKENGAGVLEKCVVNITIQLPRSSTFSTGDVADLVSYGVDLVTDGGFSGSGIAGTTNLSAVLRGES
jgi:hypothetical protein